MDGNKVSHCNKTLREYRVALRKRIRKIKSLKWETENYRVERHTVRGRRKNMQKMDLKVQCVIFQRDRLV